MSNDSNEPEVARVCFSGLFQDTWDIFMEKIGLFALMGLVLTIILGGMMFAGMLVSWVSTLLVLLPQVDSGGGGLHGLTSADILVPLSLTDRIVQPRNGGEIQLNLEPSFEGVEAKIKSFAAERSV